MLVDVDYKEIQGLFNKHRPQNPYTEEEAIEAFHNLVNFINLLIEINDEAKLVPFDQ